MTRKEEPVRNALSGQTILITGAGSGLGLELARQLSERSVQLLLVDVNEAKLKSEATKLAGAVHAFTCDVTDLDQVAHLFDQVKKQSGQLDILVNSAGIWTDNDLEERDPARRRQAFLVNSLGPIQVTEAALPLLRLSRRPQIINVISTGGASDTPAGDNTGWLTYGATKWAMRGYTKDLSKLLEPEGIKVTGFFPAGFESNLYENAGSRKSQNHNAPWMMRTEDVAEALIFAMTRPPDVQVEALLLTKRSTKE
jgi:3alpha(or 20beta)-hydroxysteroid dehydrogenase